MNCVVPVGRIVADVMGELVEFSIKDLELPSLWPTASPGSE